MLLSYLPYIQFSVTLVNSNPDLICNIPFFQPALRIHHRFRIHCQQKRYGDSASNAEEFRYKFQEEEEDQGFGDDFKQWEEGRDDIIDKIWILKVFKAYGYLLPGIIVSLLLTTGLKAFLITLAIPLSLSAISIAFENLWGGVPRKPRTRARARGRANKKKNPFRMEYSGKNSSQRQEKGKGKSKYSERNGYKSWIYSMNFSKEDDMESRLGKNSFGGWDELDNEQDSVKKSPSIQPKKRMKEENVSRKGKNRDNEQDSVKKSPSIQPKKRMKEENVSRKGKNRDDEPLLLRLLIAVFPFLRSWTMML